MKRLYSPWRQKYVTRDLHNNKQQRTTEEKCIFCNHIKEKNDEKYYILLRGKHHIILLNLYPYNAGHLLIVPIKHVKNLSELSKQARQETIELITLCTEILEKKMYAQGINIGINLGKIAGAGIPGHLHVHVLPRWEGDTNFLPTLCDTKQVSCDLERIYKDLKSVFQKHKK